MIFIAIVTKNTIDTAIATLWSFFLFIGMLIFPYRCDENISEVIRRTMAVIASQRLMSQIDKGNFTLVAHPGFFEGR